MALSKNFTTGKIPKQLLLFTLPFMASNALQVLYSTVDMVIVGKFVGVFTFSWLAIRLKVVSLPTGTTWQSFASVCIVCGIGFTVSMFIADLSYASLGTAGDTMLSQAKLGVLLGSVISALLGCIMLHKTLPKVEKE